jgi:glyoxylase-like metal-dependent hydrolase (beta-lactamase superfamily II)
MDELSLKIFVVGDLANNCYLIFSKKSKKGFIIDCPSPTHAVRKFIENNNLDILFIALTHAHFDHITGLTDFDIPCYVHGADGPFFENAQLNGSSFFSRPLVINRRPSFYDETPGLSFDNVSLRIIHTPGHTPGSVVIYYRGWLFSGDTLFYRSVGRTDIPQASQESLLASIRTKLLILPPETVVYPGHGPATTIGEEKEQNPFL